MKVASRATILGGPVTIIGACCGLKWLQQKSESDGPPGNRDKQP